MQPPPEIRRAGDASANRYCGSCGFVKPSTQFYGNCCNNCLRQCLHCGREGGRDDFVFNDAGNFCLTRPAVSPHIQHPQHAANHLLADFSKAPTTCAAVAELYTRCGTCNQSGLRTLHPTGSDCNNCSREFCRKQLQKWGDSRPGCFLRNGECNNNGKASTVLRSGESEAHPVCVAHWEDALLSNSKIENVACHACHNRTAGPQSHLCTEHLEEVWCMHPMCEEEPIKDGFCHEHVCL